MRIVAGDWRGRRLTAPAGQTTRPTADRVRQALFDRLMHADWAGRDAIVAARVLDVFAGTGAYGLEALSRGAAQASFIERDPMALTALRANIAACSATSRCRIIEADVRRVGAGEPHDIVFLDPPYRAGLIDETVDRLTRQGWLAAHALIIAEIGHDESAPPIDLLADRTHGPARLIVWRIAAR